MDEREAQQMVDLLVRLGAEAIGYRRSWGGFGVRAAGRPGWPTNYLESPRECVAYAAWLDRQQRQPGVGQP